MSGAGTTRRCPGTRPAASMPLADTMPSATARGSEPGANARGDRPDGVARPHHDGAGVPEPVASAWNACPRGPSTTVRTTAATADKAVRRRRTRVRVMQRHGARTPVRCQHPNRTYVCNPPSLVLASRPSRRRVATMSDITARQQRILDFISETVRDRGYPPTVREIGEAVGLTSSSSVHAQLANLERKGLLHRDPTKPRAIGLADRIEGGHGPPGRPHRGRHAGPGDRARRGPRGRADGLRRRGRPLRPPGER